MLLEGESGTGKELFARALHALEPARRRPVRRDQLRRDSRRRCSRPSCSATRRARSPAPSQRKLGQVRAGARGTLFLDEIGELPLPLQAKLLRVLEEQAFERVGGTATIQVDVRIVAATNRDLRQAVAARQFREDLYFRLSVFPIDIPPLRERPDDIPMLARHFIERRTAGELGQAALPLTAAALDALAAYAGPATSASCRTASSGRSILAEGETISPSPLEPRRSDGRRRAAAGRHRPGRHIELSGRAGRTSTQRKLRRSRARGRSRPRCRGTAMTARAAGRPACGSSSRSAQEDCCEHGKLSGAVDRLAGCRG